MVVIDKLGFGSDVTRNHPRLLSFSLSHSSTGLFLLVDAMVDSTWNLTHVDDSDDSDLTDLSSNENDEIDQLALDRHEHSGPAPPQQTNSGTTRKTTRPSTQAATQKSKERNKDKWPKAAVQLRQNSSLSASNIYGEPCLLFVHPILVTWV
jgi:hypothetical protein